MTLKKTAGFGMISDGAADRTSPWSKEDMGMLVFAGNKVYRRCYINETLPAGHAASLVAASWWDETNNEADYVVEVFDNSSGLLIGGCNDTGGSIASAQKADLLVYGPGVMRAKTSTGTASMGDYAVLYGDGAGSNYFYQLSGAVTLNHGHFLESITTTEGNKDVWVDIIFNAAGAPAQA
ncbi:MAG: hypothetical protein ACE5D3_01585 [Candidatus Binatia bacterium]